MHTLLAKDGHHNEILWKDFKRLSKNEAECRRNNWHLLPTPDVRHRGHSLELRHLIRDCLIIRPELRPSAKQLRDRARRGLEESLRRFRARYGREPEWVVRK